MKKTITAKLTRCRHGQPLVELDSAPFNGMEARPDELRRMAQQLTTLADMADNLPTGGKYFSPIKVCIGDEESVSSPDLSADHRACLEMLDLIRGLVIRDRNRLAGTPAVRRELSIFVAKVLSGSNLDGLDKASFTRLSSYASEINGDFK